MDAIDPAPDAQQHADSPVVDAPVRRSRGTGILIAACAVVCAAAIGAAIVLPQGARAEIRNDADATLRAFLDDAAARDDDWRELTSPLLTSVVPVGAPLAGDSPAAEALDLQTSYEVLSLRLDSRAPEYADTAAAIVEVTYSYELFGKEQTASIPQKIWLTRAFYYGDGIPTVADRGKTASAVGPWRVAGITVPQADDMPEDAPVESSTSLKTERRDADGVHCFSPLSALVQLADAARVDGQLASGCFAGADDGADVVGDDVVLEDLLVVFPAIDETDPLSIPPELMRVSDDSYHGLRAPFTQFLLGEGDDAFTITVATASSDGSAEAARIVGIHPAGEATG